MSLQVPKPRLLSPLNCPLSRLTSVQTHVLAPTVTQGELKQWDAAQVDHVVKVADSPHELDTMILRIIYLFKPPSFKGNLDGFVECLFAADKYVNKGAMSQLHGALSRLSTFKALRVYTITSRFGFADIAESALLHIFTLVNLTGISQLPDDSRVVPGTDKLTGRCLLVNILDAYNSTMQKWCNCLQG